MNVSERLSGLRVHDVMARDVIEVAAHETMAGAATRLIAGQVSGAPVVDERGRCVGLISATDFVRHVAGQRAERTAATQASTVDRRGWDCAEDLVADHMSHAIQTIAAAATLLEAARIMCGAHIHRLLVVDDRGRSLGMLTSLDVIAAVVNSFDESRHARPAEAGKASPIGPEAGRAL